jgi:hypothetical protein
VNLPVESVIATQACELSGRTKDSTRAPAATEPLTQSKARPVMRVPAVVGPVEKKVEAPVFLTLPRMSARPRSIVTV